MILLDASIWIDHIRSADPDTSDLLGRRQALCHPFVRGEVALGQFRTRDATLALMRALPVAETASDDEVMAVIERHGLFGSGIGYVDAHLVASTLLTDRAELWTRDKRLRAVAERLGIAAKGLR